MYEFESLAGPVYSIDGGLAEALTEALNIEMHSRVDSFYAAIAAGASDVPVFAPALVA